MVWSHVSFLDSSRMMERSYYYNVNVDHFPDVFDALRRWSCIRITFVHEEYEWARPCSSDRIGKREGKTIKTYTRDSEFVAGHVTQQQKRSMCQPSQRG
jgi:hypothetical protein